MHSLLRLSPVGCPGCCVLLVLGAQNHGSWVSSSLMLVLALKWCLIWNMVSVVSLRKSELRGEGIWPKGDTLTKKYRVQLPLQELLSCLPPSILSPLLL